MAEPADLKVVQQGADAIRAWRKGHAPSAQFDLVGAELSHADLRKANLNDADLSQADLKEAKLAVATLIRANLKRAELSGAKLERADLSHADLSEAKLNLARLKGAYLIGAKLERADLFEANLSGVRLSGANLEGADLRGANLEGADLRGANLEGADLSGANLRSADLSGANLSGATCAATGFGDVDLSEVRGLDAIHHFGPSVIGVDTLFKSMGRIPEVFLRGAGVPEIMIEYLGSMLGAAVEFYSCFISYSHADKAFARRLHDALQGRGIRCWLDEHQLLPGDVVRDQITEGIKTWDKVLFCVSQHSLTSWWVDKELTSAFAKEERLSNEAGKKILALIPLNLDGSLLAWTSGWADDVRSRLAADFTGWPNDSAKFEMQFERIVKALRSDEGARQRRPTPKLC